MIKEQLADCILAEMMMRERRRVKLEKGFKRRQKNGKKKKESG